jgi:hypothetical protein
MAISQPSIGDAACSSLDQAYTGYRLWCQRLGYRPASYDEWLRCERFGYGRTEAKGMSMLTSYQDSRRRAASLALAEL